MSEAMTDDRKQRIAQYRASVESLRNCLDAMPEAERGEAITTLNQLCLHAFAIGVLLEGIALKYEVEHE